MVSEILLYTNIILGSGVLFVNIYNSVIDSAIWGSDMPGSIEVARNYFNKKTPGDFFKLFGTALHLVGLIAVVWLWVPAPGTRWYLVTAFLLFVMMDVFTIAYFFPRNDIMFKREPEDSESVRKAWRQWDSMNWLRSLIALAGVLCLCLALHQFYVG